MTETASDAKIRWLQEQIEGDLARWREHVGMLRYRTFVSTPQGVVMMAGLESVIELDDAEERVADAEAKLAILGEHYTLSRGDTSEAYQEFSVISFRPDALDHGCVTCHYKGYGVVDGYGICRTVRLLAAAYCHRTGYAEHWGEATTG